MVKLSNVKLMNATTKDFAQALNLTMRESKKAAKVITSQFGLNDSVKPRDVLKIYPDTFEKSGKIIAKKQLLLANEVKTLLKNKKSVDSLNMFDFVKALLKQFRS